MSSTSLTIFDLFFKIMESSSGFTLSNGRQIPSLGLGTLFSKEGDVKRAVTEALSLGYRLIDTAASYKN